MSNLTNNTSNLQSILETINNLPKTISVDETLTRSGHAADSAVVGKRFEGIAEEIKAFGPGPAVDEAPWEVLKTTTIDEAVWAITLDGFSAEKILIEVDVPPTGESARGAGVVAVNESHILYNEAFTDPSTTRRARIVVSIKNGYLNIDYCYSVMDTNSMDWREFLIHKTCALGIAATDIHSVMINTVGAVIPLLPAGTIMTIKGVRANA